MPLGELNRFQQKGNFFFNFSDKLTTVCNAPDNASGIYLIYAMIKGEESLIYIGISGRKGENEEIIHRKDGLRGRFVKGMQFGNRRQITWPQKMKEENIQALSIHWFVTYGDIDKEFPRDIEQTLISRYKPRWNMKA